MTLATDLNLELASRRYKEDLKDKSFYDNPYIANIIDDNLGPLIDYLREKLVDYNPSPAEIINIPKKDYHLRPGAVITPEDSIIYQALLLLEVDKIKEYLKWSVGEYRFAHVLKDDQTSARWFHNEYEAWTNFKQKCLENYHKGYTFVVFADVSACYENISIQRLISDMNEIGIRNDIRNILSRCLNRWAEPRARGIPQASRPSDILAEIYFNSIDRRLCNKRIKFCRYVDDIRIFCTTKNDAIAAMHLLTVLLREKELNLQTGKSFILEGDKAIKEIDSISVILQTIEEDIKHELQGLIAYEIQYAGPQTIEKVRDELDDEIDLESIRRAFDHFLKLSEFHFDKTFFHYCINRLGAAKDDYAVEYCLKCLIDRPEEFEHILPYFSSLDSIKIPLAETIIDSFNPGTHIMSRSYYLLLRWIYSESFISDKIIEFCRDIMNRSDIDDYTKHYSWALLGKYGNSADIDSLQALYSNCNREITKATIICAVHKMVTDRRNSMFSRAEPDGHIVRYAIKTTKDRA